MADDQDKVIETGKKKKGPMLLAFVVVLVLGGGGGLFFFIHRVHPAGKSVERISQVKAVMHLEPFVLNTGDPAERAYLRIGIDLGLDRVPNNAEKDVAPAPTALVRDTILTVLAGARPEDIAAAEGKAGLKDQIVKSLQARAPGLGVREVYFTEFLVQN